MMKESQKPMSCKEAQRNFAALQATQPGAQATAVGQHLAACAPCAVEYRLVSLERTVLELTAAPESVTPDEAFFVALRARIARGPAAAASGVASPLAAEDFWANTLWATARQLIPAMALLLLLIVGATMMWGGSAPLADPSLDAQYKVRGMTAEDMLETFVAEERINGR